jgi:anaerobic dimethyl sulfoxide reductase subunit B (iron-sulfur subunit)
MQYAFYYDQTACSQCGTCTVACKDYNDVKPGKVKWRKIHEHAFKETGVFPNIVSQPLVYSCNHCADPACVKACTVGAITKRAEDGIVIIDRKKCINLRLCVTACPYGAPQIADDTQEVTKSDWQVPHPTQKCTFCLDRWKENKKPICVMSCQQRALDAGPDDYIRVTYPEAVFATEAAGFPSDLANGSRTGPNLYIKKRS